MMKNKNILFATLCGAGGGLIGSSASQLHRPAGILLFALGVALLVFSIIKLSK